MKRRDFLKLSTLGAAGMGGLTAQGMPGAAKASSRPNLLFIFPDQYRLSAMGFWQQDAFKDALGTAGDPVVTPAIDRLANEGMVLTQAVSTCPVCSPYRGMLLSGAYPWKNGIVNNCREGRQDGLRHDLPCLTDVLAEEGYETMYLGKTHWERNDPLFDERGDYVGSTEAPGGHRMNAYDTYIPPGAGRHGNRYWFQCVKDVHKDPRVYSNDPSRINGKRDGEQHRPKIYSPLLEADVLVDYLNNTDQQRDTSRPFSVIWAPNPPHNPYSSTKDCDEVAYREHYEGKSNLLCRPNAFNTGVESDAANKAGYYFANVTGVDKQVNRVLQALEDSGEAENTIVVFTSDHGEMMGSHGDFGKLQLYDEAYRVPFIIRYPGRIQKRIEDLKLSPVDIMPTLLGMMGLGRAIPSSVAGKDFSEGLLYNDWSQQPKPASSLYLGYGNRFKGVRTDRYSFQIDKDGKQLLFNNEADPYQMKSVALSDILQADRDFLMSELGQWLEVSGDPWFDEKKFADVIQYPG